MKLLKTIRGQLTLYFVIAFGVMLSVFSVILYNVFAWESRSEMDKGMLVLATYINYEVKNDSNQVVLPGEVREAFIPFNRPRQRMVKVLDASWQTVFELNYLKIDVNKDWVDESFSGSPVFRNSNVEIEDEQGDSYYVRFLFFPTTYKSKDAVIVIGVSLSNLESTLFEFRLVLYIAIPLTLLLSSVLGWLFSKKAYDPVNELIKKTNTITANNLDSRLPVNDSGDEISGLTKTLNDMMMRLQKSFLVLRQFTSDASHELRTPLTILKGEMEVALNRERSVSEYKNILYDNLEEVERLQRIVDGLLTLSSLESGKTRVQTECVNINELLTEAAAKINKLAKSKNIKVILKLNTVNDNRDREVYVRGDPGKLLNVFINLLDNAVKYSDANSEIICSVQLASVGDKINISFKDNGIGISPENLENIFDRFYRADQSRAKDDRNSIGLGLAIVKSVIESHNGNISVTSNQGQGSTFTVILPGFSEKTF